jgi:RNA polymerase sigma-70 factor (ECF subfamily)
MRAPEHWDWNRLRSHCEREARRLLPNVHDAEDAVQEAMARAWRQRHNCRSPEAPLPWLLRITRNEVFRITGRRNPLVPCPLAAGEPEPGRVDHDIERLALKLDVHRALARLPSRDRTLVSLRYGEDLAQNRIAALLGAPEGTIKVQLHRLRQRLRGDLRETIEGDHQPH